jgi:hypothetical protein
MLDRLGVLILYASMHTADPGSTGTGEVTGGTYTRESITWLPASGGVLDSSNAPVFDIPAGTTITHAGFWSALTGGVFYGADLLVAADEATAAPETFTSAGTYTLNDAKLEILD